ncbi:DUF402 domain-containing protein [Kitasatospora purpeofusca]|uniref:DUF402 domain-containing protein n=1 Tax=Kitasatospora purpeofusca TaxID=67352 RepID=UPI0030EFE048
MTDTDLFQPGTTVVRRDVHAGRVWTAMPQRVVADTGHVLTLAYWPGIGSLAPTSWITSLATGDDTARKQGLADLAAGTWTLGPYRWQGTELLSHFLAGEWFSVHCFQDATTKKEPLRWYVDFEHLYQRHALGIVTVDLALDLVVTPDLSGHHWKDREEYAQLRRLGVVDGWTAGQIDRARGRAIGMLADRTGPGRAGRRPRPADALAPARPALAPDAVSVGPVGACRPGGDGGAQGPLVPLGRHHADRTGVALSPDGVHAADRDLPRGRAGGDALRVEGVGGPPAALLDQRPAPVLVPAQDHAVRP